MGNFARGVGCCAVFSVVRGALLRPLPYRDAERIAVVWHTFGTGQSLPAIHPKDYRDYKERSRTFEDFTLISGFETLFQAKGDPELVRVGNVASNFFTFLGVDPLLGRHFLSSDDLPSSARVVWYARQGLRAWAEALWFDRAGVDARGEPWRGLFVNARVGWQFSSGVGAFALGENLLDTRFETLRGLSTPGRVLWVGVALDVDED